MINYVFGCKVRWHTTKIHANNRKNSRMRLLYIRNLVKEWLKATFRLFRHTLSHKNGVKKDTEGILNIDINNFSSTFHTDDKKKIILMLHLVSRRQRAVAAILIHRKLYSVVYPNLWDGISLFYCILWLNQTFIE